jgi:hypothetical protein
MANEKTIIISEIEEITPDNPELSPKWSITTSTGKKCSAWIGNWNKDWGPGMTIQAIVEDAGVRTKAGMSVYNLKCPPRS